MKNSIIGKEDKKWRYVKPGRGSTRKRTRVPPTFRPATGRRKMLATPPTFYPTTEVSERSPQDQLRIASEQVDSLFPTVFADQSPGLSIVGGHPSWPSSTCACLLFRYLLREISSQRLSASYLHDRECSTEDLDSVTFQVHACSVSHCWHVPPAFSHERTPRNPCCEPSFGRRVLSFVKWIKINTANVGEDWIPLKGSLRGLKLLHVLNSFRSCNCQSIREPLKYSLGRFRRDVPKFWQSFLYFHSLILEERDCWKPIISKNSAPSLSSFGIITPSESLS